MNYATTDEDLTYHQKNSVVDLESSCLNYHSDNVVDLNSVSCVLEIIDDLENKTLAF